MRKQEIEVSEKKQFEFDGLAEILHLNTRKEGKEEDGKELALDVKFKVKIASTGFSFFECDELGKALYTDIGAVKNIFIEPISLSYELKNYSFEVSGREYFGINLKKFVLEPLDGYLLAVSFQATFKPTANEVALMAEHLQDMVKIKLHPENLQLDFNTKEVEK